MAESLNSIYLSNDYNNENKDIVIELYKVGKLTYKVAKNIIKKMKDHDPESDFF